MKFNGYEKKQEKKNLFKNTFLTGASHPYNPNIGDALFLSRYNNNIEVFRGILKVSRGL